MARRTNLAIGACGGNDRALAGAVIAGEELGWSPGEKRPGGGAAAVEAAVEAPAIGDTGEGRGDDHMALRTLDVAALP
ncbi:MAG: hypothetical protein IPF99_27025 [Deltaproteobacteria bacterium]|nr:hypothetical protein [Deltaproteobacteria bacterium]